MAQHSEAMAMDTPLISDDGGWEQLLEDTLSSDNRGRREERMEDRGGRRNRPLISDNGGWEQLLEDTLSSDNGGRREERMEDRGGRRNRQFQQEYICFPISHIDKHHLEDGNKVIMPASALGRLMDLGIEEYPMLFEINNPSSGRVSHCGVLEFSAEEGFVLLPNWMMKNMKLREGDMVNIKNVSLPKAEYMKIQPHETKFVMNIKNPKDVLEAVLKDFTCVTAGDTIMITHECQKYYIDIVETKPSNAVSLFETDCEVDFAPPLDYKEPEKKPTTVIKWKNEKTERVKEKPAEEKEEPKFKPFTGVARRLDGQTAMKEELPLVAEAGQHIATNESNGTSRKRDRNLVFGTNNDAQKPAAKVTKEDVQDKSLTAEGAKFKPFTGKKYTLAG